MAACSLGRINIVEMLIDKSVPLQLDLTATFSGLTGFYLACRGGHTNVVELLLDKSESVNFDLTAKDKRYGETGYQMAEFFKTTEVINLIKTNMPGLVKLPSYKCSSCDSISFAKKSKLTDHIVSVHEGK